MRSLAVALALTSTHGFMSHKLRHAHARRGDAADDAPRQRRRRNGGGAHGPPRRGLEKGHRPQKPGRRRRHDGRRPAARHLPEAADDEGEEPPAPKAAEAAGLWAAYEKALEKDPLLIKGLTSMTGFAIGDILAQQFIEKKGKYNLNRTIVKAPRLAGARHDVALVLRQAGRQDPGHGRRRRVEGVC